MKHYTVEDIGMACDERLGRALEAERTGVAVHWKQELLTYHNFLRVSLANLSGQDTGEVAETDSSTEPV